MKRRKRLFIDISVQFAPQLSALSSWNVCLFSRFSNSLCVSGILPGTVVWRISLDTVPAEIRPNMVNPCPLLSPVQVVTFFRGSAVW
jgi:hypothetical protein